MAPGGIAAVAQGAARPAAPPLVVVSSPIDWILTPTEVAAWLARARPGARLIYGRGGHMIQGATQQLLRRAAEAGGVFLFQPRSADGQGFDFLCVKRSSGPALAPSPKARPSAGDLAQRTIYRRLKRAAAGDERCPTDAQLAALTGLRVPQVKWRLALLVQAGKIARRVVPTPTDPNFRVIAILSTGRETAAPQ